MITVITGNPGSGKTYYAVYLCLKKYYEKVGHEYITKDDLEIISDIEDLKLPHITFNPDIHFNQSYYSNLKKRLLIIEEARICLQKPQESYLQFLQYHRHLGCEIILITQSIEQLAKQVQYLIEQDIQAVSPSLRLKKYFRYHVSVSGCRIDSFTIPFDLNISRLYKSFRIDEIITNRRKPLVKYISYFSIFLVLTLSLFVAAKFAAGRLFASEKVNKHALPNGKLISQVSKPVEFYPPQRREIVRYPIPAPSLLPSQPPALKSPQGFNNVGIEKQVLTQSSKKIVGELTTKNGLHIRYYSDGTMEHINETKIDN